MKSDEQLLLLLKQPSTIALQSRHVGDIYVPSELVFNTFRSSLNRNSRFHITSSNCKQVVEVITTTALVYHDHITITVYNELNQV